MSGSLRLSRAVRNACTGCTKQSGAMSLWACTPSYAFFDDVNPASSRECRRRISGAIKAATLPTPATDSLRLTNMSTTRRAKAAGISTAARLAFSRERRQLFGARSFPIPLQNLTGSANFNDPTVLHQYRGRAQLPDQLLGMRSEDDNRCLAGELL